MKQMYVHGFFQSNLGDDLFVLRLARRYPETKFYVYALGANQNAFLGQPNIVLPTKANRIVRKLTHSLHLSRQEVFDGQGLDGTVVIGGSIFWEGANLSFPKGDGPCYIIGANCESGYSPEYLHKLKKAVSGFDGCCLRDRFSYGLLGEFPNVTCAPDVLYGWQPRQVLQQGAGIGVSLVSQKGCFRDEQLRQWYFAAISRLCDLCTERGIPVRLLGFCGMEGDGDAIETVLARVKQPRQISHMLYSGNPERMLYEINKCQTILATRFHAMILGWVLGKNVVPILYNEKQAHVLEDAGFTGPMWNALAGEQMNGEALLDAALKDTGHLDISQLRQEADGQFAALDAFLK